MKSGKCFCLLLAVVLLVGSVCSFCNSAVKAEETGLNDEQRNAVAMLNYLVFLTQDINASKNSRVYMEESYSSLINNTYPNAVDPRTQAQLSGLLDIMEGYRMVAVKRNRLQFLYEQNQAQAIRSAIPNPLSVLNAVQSYRPSKLAISIVYMAVDSITSYNAYTEGADLQYLQSGWELDDAEAAILHDSRKGVFNYMISMVRDNNLPGDLILTEKAVDDLVEWKNNENIIGRIQFLESNQDVYKSYGGYWLILAESYYQNGDYAKCLSALDSYEALGVRIFRKDYSYARILPLAVAALDETCDGEEYVTKAAKYAQAILDNTDYDDWALRYFAAQVYLDLYGKTKDKTYLQKAFDIAMDNVNFLADEQRSINAAFLAPVQETPIPKDATNSEKDQINDYNRMLREKRKNELPQIYEPLLLNSELLFAVSGELDISESDKMKIDGILHPKGAQIFLNAPLDDLFWAVPKEGTAYDTTEIEFAGTALKIPAKLVTDKAKIVVSVKEVDTEEPDIISDWKLVDVTRKSDYEINDMQAVYTSDSARLHNWKPDAVITVSITPYDGMETKTFEVKYKSVGTKREWYDYLKVWEGHKNEWYDYLKVWDNSVSFERME